MSSSVRHPSSSRDCVELLRSPVGLLPNEPSAGLGAVSSGTLDDAASSDEHANLLPASEDRGRSVVEKTERRPLAEWG
eukprot:7194840-Prymnesium_polylepis.1